MDLTHREFELLHHLASHLGQVITREHLLETGFGVMIILVMFVLSMSLLDVYVRRLKTHQVDLNIS